MIINSPCASYGIAQQTQLTSELDAVVEQVRELGYAVISSKYTEAKIKTIAEQFDYVRELYVEMYGKTNLENINELHTIRSPLTHDEGDEFLSLALNENLLLAIKKLISGTFILNQQNGIINPAQETYNQGLWHRDLPYQHFVSSKPLAINALYCVDDFTCENGATFVLPASHKSEPFPSLSYVKKNAIQIEASAGSFILLDCMLFHAGGYNGTRFVRRAVNHVYNIPFFKQQINIPMNLNRNTLSNEEKEILGFSYLEPTSALDYLSGRKAKKANDKIYS